MRRRTFLATVGSASGAVLAGCGDSEGDPAAGNESNAGQQIGGDAQAGDEESDPASTPDEPATPDETTTPAEETDTETEGTSTSEETDTPDESGEGAENSMEYPGEYVDVRDVEYEDNEGESTGPTVSGVVQNTSAETLSLVEAKIWAYDENDEEVGEALDDTTDLGPGETWEFECELWDTEAENVDSWEGRIDVSTY